MYRIHNYYEMERPRFRRVTTEDKVCRNLTKMEISRDNTKSSLRADRKFFRGQNHGR